MKQYIIVKELLNVTMDSNYIVTPQLDGYTNENFICIPGHYGPRWIIPADSKLGLPVLKHWQPYNFLSKFKWLLLLSLYNFCLLSKVPKITCLNINIETGTKEIPVIYIGTPGLQQKAVVTFVSVKTKKPQSVMKIALGDKAKDSMAKEASILNALEQCTMPGTVPVLLGSAKNYEWTMQTVVQGCLTGRKLTRAHIDWLLALPRSTKTTTLYEQQKQIQKMIHSCQALDLKDKQNILQKIVKITGGTIPLILVHGDFAPWNLKIQPDNKITAIDWENAEFAGLPLWDLCHFFFIQGHLFNTHNPFKSLKTNPLIQIYLKKIGLKRAQILPLVLLYILLMIVDKDRITSAQYKKYLLQQLQLIV